jgi:poly(A) polymerase
MTPSIKSSLESHVYYRFLEEVGAVASAHGIEAYAVGGVVRDAILGRKTTDVDFVSVGQGSGIRLARLVGEALGGEQVHVYENFGTAAIRIHDPAIEEPLVLEFVGARRESYRRNSRKPIVEEGTIEDDQQRRDFTVNAMAIHLIPERFGELIDPFDGLSDLESRLLRTPLEARRTFEDDPLRMIRGARFAAQLGFRLDDSALDAMRDAAARVEILSQERITEEVQNIVTSPEPATGFRILFETKILQRTLPELADLHGVEAIHGQRHKDNFYHTLQVVQNLIDLLEERPTENEEWLRWAALLHDIGKPKTKRYSSSAGWTFHGHEDVGSRMIKKVFQRMKLPMDERMEYVEKLVRLHHRPVALVDDDVTDSAVRRLLFDAGDDVDDLMMLVRADITSKNPQRVRRYLNAFDRVERKLIEVEEKDNLRNFQPPIDGHEIMRRLGVGEGVEVGIVKEAIREAILDGLINNEYGAASAYLDALQDEALRRGRLFRLIVDRLRGPERRAMGAIKERIFSGPLPMNEDEAMRELMEIVDDVAGGTREGEQSAEADR